MIRALLARGWFWPIAFCLGACTVVSADDPDAGGGGGSGGESAAGAGGSITAGNGGTDGGAAGTAGAGTAGKGGSAGSGGASGAGGSANDPCQGVPWSGACKDTQTVQMCMMPEDENKKPYLVEAKCDQGWTCVADKGGARCTNSKACTDGDTRCFGTQTLETCKAGQWIAELCGGTNSCQAVAGQPAQCVAMAGEGQTYPLSGALQYEYRLPKDTKDPEPGLGPKEVATAWGVIIAVWTGDEYVGGAITGDEGKFTVEMSKPAAADTVVFAFPMAFSDQSSQPLHAVALPPEDDPEGHNSPAYWSFSYPAAIEPGATDLGPWLVTEEDGSGALWMYEWQDWGMFRMREMYPDVEQHTVLTFWKPGVQFECGACFWPASKNATVDLGNGEQDHYESAFQFSGLPEGPKHWMRSSIGHEFGHYVMQYYSLSPQEGGPHSSSVASAPGLAYSEGWATFFGQRNQSELPDALEPVYYSVGAEGTYWWFDLDKIALSDDVPKADPSGPIDQPISESLVSYMMWHMWAPDGETPPYKGLGDSALFGAIRSNRILDNDKYNRGYFRVDYQDYADALVCADSSYSSAVTETAEPVGYPYNPDDKTCP